MAHTARPKANLRVLFVLTLILAVSPAAADPASRLWEPSGEGDRLVPGVEPGPTVARIWDEALLDAIRTDRPKPPTHARNLYHLSVAMWDAWAAYDPDAIGVVFTEKHTDADVASARREAISYAAYRLLMHRFPGGGFDLDGQPCQPGAEDSQDDFQETLQNLGYDPAFDSTVGDTPAAIGNRIGQAVIDFGLTDGANEGFDLCYPDDSGYFPVNDSLIFDLPGADVFDPNHWQPLAFDFLVLQNGIIIGQAVQSFVGVGWADVVPFGLGPADLPPDGQTLPCTPAFGAPPPYFDPGCPPQLGGEGDAELKDAVVELIEFQSWVDPADGVEIDLSPSVYGNNPLGTDDGVGHPVNPFTGEPYPPNVVKRADYARTLAEFWADGPESETPPGHWNVLANYVTDHADLTEKRLGGPGGPLLDDLEWEVKLYLALNGAVHDAAIAAWGSKHYYDSSRPITLIRHMGELGQSSDPEGPSYHPQGLPLVPNLIEVITEETIAPGERHEDLSAFCELGFNDGLPCVDDNDCPDDGPFDGVCVSGVGQMAIRAWLGGPEDPVNEVGGVGWLRAIQWMPYQASNFVSPPFPGYTSGHSTFSRAGAEVLSDFTGSEFFPGGLGTFTAYAHEYLRFEDGPSETVELRWGTYADAADEAGLSRRFGGIHPVFDDLPGRVQGVLVGQSAFEKALEYYNQPLDGDDDGKVTICHVPPGNQGQAHTIAVAEAAVPAHMAHGDSMGPCAQDDSTPAAEGRHGSENHGGPQAWSDLVESDDLGEEQNSASPADRKPEGRGKTHRRVRGR